MFRFTRLSSKHVTIRYGFGSADMSVGATSYEHQNWTSDKENRGDGTRRRCQHFCEVTKGHLNYRDLLPTYGRETGARLNIRNLKAMAAGLWDKSMNILIIPCNQEMTVLGFRFTSIVTRSGMSLGRGRQGS